MARRHRHHRRLHHRSKERRHIHHYHEVPVFETKTQKPTSTKSKIKTGIAIGVTAVVVIAIIVFFFNKNPQVEQGLFSSNSTPYLNQAQLFNIYGIGSYGNITAPGTKENVNGTALASFISQGSQISNFSIPSITFAINTSISNITIDNSYLVGFRIVKNSQNQLLLREQVISSPQASYLFFAQSQIASYDGYINGMQYYVVNNTEVIANKDSYVVIFKCEGTLCTNQTVNSTIHAISKDNI